MNLKLAPKTREKFFNNAKVFLAPVGVIYLVFVIGNLNADGGSFSLSHFIPSPFVLGAISLYILNNLLDYLRKVKK